MGDECKEAFWEEQAVNANKMEVVADPVLSPHTSSLQSGSPPSPRSLFAPAPGCGSSWLLHLGGEDLQKVALQCCLAVLILLIMKIRQEFIILL